MAMSESEWIHRAQTAEASLQTCREQIERVKEKYKNLTGSLCARERGDGSFDIDFDGLVQKLSLEHALALRAAIDEHHRVTGAPGEKPKVRISA